MTDILKTEAERYLSAIFQQFSQRARHVRFPLTEAATCRVFGETATEAMTMLWSSESRLPPTALILAMTRVCEKLANPSSSETGVSADLLGIPRPFAQEMLERLRCELPPTAAFALDQVGRIVNEAGNLTQAHDVRHAFLTYRLRHHGAIWAAELDQMVAQIWAKRYRQYVHLMHPAPAREAA